MRKCSNGTSAIKMKMVQLDECRKSINGPTRWEWSNGTSAVKAKAHDWLSERRLMDCLSVRLTRTCGWQECMEDLERTTECQVPICSWWPSAHEGRVSNAYDGWVLIKDEWCMKAEWAWKPSEVWEPSAHEGWLVHVGQMSMKTD